MIDDGELDAPEHYLHDSPAGRFYHWVDDRPVARTGSGRGSGPALDGLESLVLCLLGFPFFVGALAIIMHLAGFG